MARVVVIGGGFGGLASAARLAKLGHEVTLLEARHRLGGALGYVEKDGFRWDAGPTSTLLPGGVRDFFRKSGRAAEKEIDLVPVEPAQQHRFDDDTVLDLPGGSRAAQLEAVGAALGAGSGGRWVGYVDDFAEVWEALRKDCFERPWSPEHASKEATALLDSRLTLHKLVEKEFKDKRLRALATHRVALRGPRPPQRTRLGRDVVLRRAELRILDPPRRHGPARRGPGRPAGTRGVTVITGVAAQDLLVDAVTNKVTGVRAVVAEVETARTAFCM